MRWLANEELAHVLDAAGAEAVEDLHQANEVGAPGVLLARHQAQELARVFHVYRAAGTTVEPVNGQEMRIWTRRRHQLVATGQFPHLHRAALRES